jgi:hypothetical protein
MDVFKFWGDSGSDLDGLRMSSYWWVYPATAIPLTVVVVLIWHLWRQSRLERKSRSLPDLESGRSTESLGGVVKQSFLISRYTSSSSSSLGSSASSGSAESVGEKEKVT